MSNNFKLLFEAEEERFRPYERGVRENISHQLGVYRLIGSIVDMYLSKAGEVLMTMANADISREMPPNAGGLDADGPLPLLPPPVGGGEHRPPTDPKPDSPGRNLTDGTDLK